MALAVISSDFDPIIRWTEEDNVAFPVSLTRIVRSTDEAAPDDSVS